MYPHQRMNSAISREPASLQPIKRDLINCHSHLKRINRILGFFTEIFYSWKCLPCPPLPNPEPRIKPDPSMLGPSESSKLHFFICKKSGAPNLDALVDVCEKSSSSATYPPSSLPEGVLRVLLAPIPQYDYLSHRASRRPFRALALTATLLSAAGAFSSCVRMTSPA